MYKLNDIFNQANTDEVSINIDGVGYEARLRQGIKITKEENTFHIQYHDRCFLSRDK